MRQHPLVYEINTWVWLTDLSKQYGEPITLSNVPIAVIDEIAALGVDTVWLMGVWERSPNGRKIALEHPDLPAEYSRALPDWKPEDVVGSPYCIHRYVVDDHLGGHDGLAIFRQQLRDRGIGLILDFVPNHVAVDHPWTVDYPDAMILGAEVDIRNRPHYFFRSADKRSVIAHGRDPYFPAWTDTAQVNAFSPRYRTLAQDTLLDIASQCDGVRCDMAMLLVSRIFAQTWDALAGDPPSTEFWSEVIPAIKQAAPDFIFMAEVYWNMEAELQTLGFDYTYDKRLYDRLRHENAASVRDHLLAEPDYQRRMVRFTENHDEVRAAMGFEEKVLAATVISFLLPGLKLLHEGQLEGRKVKIPVQLGRRPAEAVNGDLLTIYRHILDELRESIYHDGVHMTLACNPILGEDRGHEQVIAFAWVLNQDWRIVAANLSANTVNTRILLPDPWLAGEAMWQFNDLFNTSESHNLRGDVLLNAGLTLELPPYHAAILTIAPAVS
ncbi:MAG: alpha-amylase [Anaerolineae bacterium]|nr:alpha-amylase [Anaerolineae bacterium]